MLYFNTYWPKSEQVVFIQTLFHHWSSLLTHNIWNYTSYCSKLLFFGTVALTLLVVVRFPFIWKWFEDMSFKARFMAISAAEFGESWVHCLGVYHVVEHHEGKWKADENCPPVADQVINGVAKILTPPLRSCLATISF